MERTLFELTPAQQDLLAALSRQTGKAIPTLLAEALEGLEARVCPGQGTSETNGGTTEEMNARSVLPTKPIWDIADEMLQGIPDEALDRLPTDGAAEHDHYIYGTPKRST